MPFRPVRSRTTTRQFPHIADLAECLLYGVSLGRMPQQVHVLIEHGLEMRITRIDQCPLCVPFVLGGHLTPTHSEAMLSDDLLN